MTYLLEHVLCCLCSVSLNCAQEGRSLLLPGCLVTDRDSGKVLQSAVSVSLFVTSLSFEQPQF